MIKSMTGFGRGNYEIDGRKYTVEIKSVNHKYSDITVKLPRVLSFLEDSVRKQIASNISRGKVDVFITFEDFSEKVTNIRFNKSLAKEYVKQLKELAEETGLDYSINVLDISKFPDILKLEDSENEELVSNELKIAVQSAIYSFIEMRAQEGNKLVEDMKNRIKGIEKIVEEISNFSSTLVPEYIEKLDARIKEYLKTDVVDEARLAQEIVIYSDKCSIEEELTRLRSHISQFNNLLKGASPIGKKLDFLVQEMNREVNTIGSKANSLDITNRVIEIKTEIENIREQVQNIE